MDTVKPTTKKKHQKTTKRAKGQKIELENISFRSKRLGVKGKLTRKEIYDWL